MSEFGENLTLRTTDSFFRFKWSHSGAFYSMIENTLQNSPKANMFKYEFFFIQQQIFFEIQHHKSTIHDLVTPDLQSIMRDKAYFEVSSNKTERHSHSVALKKHVGKI